MAQLSNLRSYYMIMIWISVGFGLVGLTNIFPFEMEVIGINLNDLQDGIIEDYDDFVAGLANGDNVLEYFNVLGTFLWMAIKIVMAAFVVVFGGFGMVMYSTGLIPLSVCALIQIPIDAMILFELGQHLLR